MELTRQEISQFVAASEHLLGHAVKRDELTNLERDMIAYYLDAIAEKFQPSSEAIEHRILATRNPPHD